ncbi:hypothetical protein VspSTUT11_15150 [Vibrio sp. STUT-A11]|nr:hypothetical protein VspSTUT11_15150 [Vibrio sp. STUT-A11]
MSPRKISPILSEMKTNTLLSQLKFVYRAKVKAICNASEECDGLSTMSIDSSFNIQIEGTNCTNDEFAKRFFVVNGEGHMEGDGWLVLYVDSIEVSVGEEIAIPSDVAFNAMIENRVQEAEEVLERLYENAMEKIEKGTVHHHTEDS